MALPVEVIGVDNMCDTTPGDSLIDHMDYGGSVRLTHAHRRRMACDTCQRKKIKCNGSTPSCVHYVNSDGVNAPGQTHKRKRAPPKRFEKITNIQKRLSHIENIFQDAARYRRSGSGNREMLGRRQIELSGLKYTTDTQTTHNVDHWFSVFSDNFTTTTRTEDCSEHGNEDTQGIPNSSSQAPCPLQGANGGANEDCWWSSVRRLTTSLFPLQDISWLYEIIRDPCFENSTLRMAANENTRQEGLENPILSDIYRRRVFEQLPPREEAFPLFNSFLREFNAMLPIYHERTFTNLLERQYGNNVQQSSGWWASVNIALATAYQLRAVKHSSQEDFHKAWMHFKNAMAVLSEMAFVDADVLCVQAILTMAIFVLENSTAPQPAFILSSMAIKMIHALGFHKSGSESKISAVEAEQRKRIFWIAYMLDKDACLRFGQPPLQDDGDMDIELPLEEPEDNMGTIPRTDCEKRFNLFRTQCQFAVIAGKIHRELYTIHPPTKSEEEVLNVVKNIEKELEHWKNSIAISLTHDNSSSSSRDSWMMSIRILHFFYYKGLASIHRISALCGLGTYHASESIRQKRDRFLEARITSSISSYLAAARASMHLTRYMGRKERARMWLFLYFPVSALVTIFANIIRNPRSILVDDDIQLMSAVVDCLSSTKGRSRDLLTPVISFCSQLTNIANDVVQESHTDEESGMLGVFYNNMQASEIESEDYGFTGHYSSVPVNDYQPPLDRPRYQYHMHISDHESADQNLWHFHQAFSWIRHQFGPVVYSDFISSNIARSRMIY